MQKCQNNTDDRRHALAQANLDAPQRHALRVPVGEGPRQRQRKLLSRDLAVQIRGHDRRAEHRHPLPPHRVLKEERSLATCVVRAQLHVIELHEHAQRDGLRRVLGPRLPHKQMIGTNHCIEPPDAVFILDTNGAIILEIN